MSRHNRRRTRGGHKHQASSVSSNSSSSSEGSSSSDPLLLYHPSWTLEPWSYDSQSTPMISATRSQANYHGYANIPARHWHNRYMAWQARERRQNEEKSYLEAEKKRIFGALSESTPQPRKGQQDIDVDDKVLEEKMLEYFGALDFLVDG